MHCISRFATFQSNVNQKTISFDAFAQKWDCVVEFLMHCHKTFSKCLYAQDKQKHPWIVLMLLCILFCAFSHFAIVISKTSRRYCANGSTPPTVSDGCWEIVQKMHFILPEHFLLMNLLVVFSRRSYSLGEKMISFYEHIFSETKHF